MKQPLFSPLTLALADEPELKGRIRRLLQAHLNREKLNPRQALLIAFGVAAALIPLAIYQNGNHPDVVMAQVMSAPTTAVATQAEYVVVTDRVADAPPPPQQAIAAAAPVQQGVTVIQGIQMAPPAPPVPDAPPAPTR